MVISPKRLHPMPMKGTGRAHTPRRTSKKDCNELAFQPGMPVFIRDDKDVYVEGVVAVVTNKCVNIRLSSGKIRMCAVSDLIVRSQVDFTQVNNLTHLSPIHSATVLACLHKRYEKGIFYTTAGTTVVAVNPFKEVHSLYCRKTVHAYRNKLKTEPHIFVIAEEAHTRLVRQLGKVDQSIIVSGESGAGKTVSAKHLLRYMTIVSNPEFIRTEIDVNLSLTATSIESRILDSNPILEAFGNAATHRNDNSSRFGKYIHLQFERTGELQGASIKTYLLEKTRVVHQCDGESNFHIFYQVCNLSCRSSNHPWLNTVLEGIEGVDFRIVPTGQDVKENRDLQQTLEAMEDIGLPQHIQKNIFQILIAILYLGNVQFSVVEEDISSQVSEDAASPEGLLATSKLLGVMPKHLEEAMLHRKIEPGQENSRRTVFVKPVTSVEACSRKDCLAMLLYSRLFHWLVDFINCRIQADHFDNTIGLLDIYGFEVFEDNSLEQLCINYANEKLQQHYVRHFLKDLQKEYEDENISWVNIKFTDNEPCLTMLEGTGSVFGLLNEEVYLNRKCSSQIIGERLIDLSKKCKTHLRKPRQFASKPSFIVVHYAGDVHYTVNKLVNKNRDNIPLELLGLLQSSTNPFIVELFSSFHAEHAPGKKKKKTVLSKFKGSLDSLMLCLNASDSHYIRCIKPNKSSKANVFDRQYSMKQLQACGIIESVEICKRGYAARIPYGEFLHRYGILINNDEMLIQCTLPDDEVDSGMDEEPLDIICKIQLPNTIKNTSTPKKILRRRTGLSSFEHEIKCCASVMRQIFQSTTEDKCLQDQFGRTKLFLHEDQLEKLESVRLRKLSDCATVIQRTWLYYRRRQLWKRQTSAALAIQSAWRRYKLRKHRQWRNLSAHIIQRSWLRYRHWKEVEHHRWSATVIQTAWHHFQFKKILKRRSEAAKTIQMAWTCLRKRQERKMKLTASDGIPKSAKICSMNSNSISIENNEWMYSRLKSRKTIITPKAKFSLEICRMITLQNSCVSSGDTACEPGIRNDILIKKGWTIDRVKTAVVSPYKVDNILQHHDLDIDVAEKTDKLLMAILKVFPKLECLHIGDGIMSRRRLPTVQIKFHTRASVLKNAHYIHRREFRCSLSDCLSIC